MIFKISTVRVCASLAIAFTGAGFVFLGVITLGMGSLVLGIGECGIGVWAVFVSSRVTV